MAIRERGGSHQQQYEFLLFGSVSEADVKALLHRLRGLCDFATTGGVSFTDREITYKIGELIGTGLAITSRMYNVKRLSREHSASVYRFTLEG